MAAEIKIDSASNDPNQRRLKLLAPENREKGDDDRAD